MRTKLGLTLLLAAGILSLVAATRRRTEPSPNKPRDTAHRLVVHEWGTFTNFSGGDGVQLKFRPLTDHLPGFVQRIDRSNPFIKDNLLAFQRMETPVMYFYADAPREVDVEVGFPQGLLTEFYPPVVEKNMPKLRWNPMNADSRLAWHVALHPAQEPAQNGNRPDGHDRPSPPPVGDDDHYGFARETDSTIVEVTDTQGQPQYEKFLFYRGVADFSLPLRLEAMPSGRFRVTNDGPEAIESLFLVMVDDEGLRFRKYPMVSANHSLDMLTPDSPATADALGEQMAEALVAAGLYEKEARAMVHTWQSSWFSEPGARLFYLLPKRLTDEILPLTLRPTPDEVVRVMVGRMEVLTPETIDGLLAVIREHGECSPDDVAPLKQAVARLGRFAEPALNHLWSLETDESLRAAIRRVARIAR